MTPDRWRLALVILTIVSVLICLCLLAMTLGSITND